MKILKTNPKFPTLQKLSHKLKEKSTQVNLFSAQDREKLFDKHFPDALNVLDFWEIFDNAKVIDMGTGGGVPGLVLAAVCPELDFWLLDSTKKKLDLLDEAIEELNLENVKTIWGRIEELAHGSDREKFDIALARALAPLPTLIEYASGFLKVGGKFYAWKSSDFKDELEMSKPAQKELGMAFVDQFDYELDGGEKRTILEFKKVRALNDKYPRRVGVPKDKPIL